MPTKHQQHEPLRSWLIEETSSHLRRYERRDSQEGAMTCENLLNLIACPLTLHSAEYRTLPYREALVYPKNNMTLRNYCALYVGDLIYCDAINPNAATHLHCRLTFNLLVICQK